VAIRSTSYGTLSSCSPSLFCSSLPSST
jgi:hypothetical protein